MPDDDRWGTYKQFLLKRQIQQRKRRAAKKAQLNRKSTTSKEKAKPEFQPSETEKESSSPSEIGFEPAEVEAECEYELIKIDPWEQEQKDFEAKRETILELINGMERGHRLSYLDTIELMLRSFTGKTEDEVLPVDG